MLPDSSFLFFHELGRVSKHTERYTHVPLLFLLSLSAIAAIQKTVHVYKISESIFCTPLTGTCKPGGGTNFPGGSIYFRKIHSRGTNLKGVQIKRDSATGVTETLTQNTGNHSSLYSCIGL